MNEIENRLIELETKVAFQEDLIEQLNQVITSQEVTISKLSRRLDDVVDTIKTQSDSGIKDLSQEVPPPHY